MSLNEIDASPALMITSFGLPPTTVSGFLSFAPIVRFIGLVSGWCPILIVSGLNWNTTSTLLSLSTALTGRLDGVALFGACAGTAGGVALGGLTFCWICARAFASRVMRGPSSQETLVLQFQRLHRDGALVAGERGTRPGDRAGLAERPRHHGFLAARVEQRDPHVVQFHRGPGGRDPVRLHLAQPVDHLGRVALGHRAFQRDLGVLHPFRQERRRRVVPALLDRRGVERDLQ